MRKILRTIFLTFLATSLFVILGVQGATILETSSSQTIGVFRTNVNTSLTNLNTELAGVSAFTGDSNFTWSSSTQNLTVSTTTIGLLSLEPDVDQTITTSTQTIVSSRSHIDLTMNGDFLLTSTPSIAAGIDGQLLILHSQSTTSTLDFQDDSILSGSDIFLNGASGTLKPASSMMLIYQADAPTGWTILSNPNTASLGGDASLLSVRNVSGGPIAAGQVVHVDGFNVGQGRPTIVLADADVPALMPAIGITATAIANGQNGQVIISGNAIGLINTSGASVGDGVWVSTTAGEVVFTRPATDDIQRLGEVTRSHATGNIIIHGAGRSNDIPVNATTTGAYNFGKLFVTGSVQFSNYASGFLQVDASGNLTTSTIDIGDDTNLGGGRSITISGDNVVADVELYTDYKCALVENLAAADDNMDIWMANFAVTVIEVGVHCTGTCTTTANISLEDRTGNAMTHTTATSSTGTANTTYIAVTSGGALVAGEGLRFDVDNSPDPETDTYTICFGVTYND